MPALNYIERRNSHDFSFHNSYTTNALIVNPNYFDAVALRSVKHVQFLFTLFMEKP